MRSCACADDAVGMRNEKLTNHLNCRYDLGPVYIEGGCPDQSGYPANRATREGLISQYVSFKNALKHLHARQGYPPT